MKDITSLPQAILVTLRYFDLFNFPLTAQELTEYLYGWAAPEDVIAEAASRMPEITNQNGVYCLRGRESLFALREERDATAQKFWKKVRRFAGILSTAPFVRMIAVCNTLSYGNVTPKSDIDVFIVTQAGHLSTVRFFMTALTHILGVRVHGELKAERFCLSFLVTEEAMNLKNIAHDFDPHLAYFVKTMVPITGSAMYEKFLETNEAWTVPYFRKKLDPRMRECRTHSLARFVQYVAEFFLLWLGPIPEFLSFQWFSKKDQAKRRQLPESTGIILRKNMVKFHERDPREEIARKFTDFGL